MKIICIGRNYADHAKELKNEVPQHPIFFLKPDSAILLKERPFYLPDFSGEIHYEVELVVKINRLGKNISENFAHRYYNEIGIGIDFTARDLQRECKAKGLPWEISKAFDQSAVMGGFLKKEVLGDLNNILFSLNINGKQVQRGNTADMIFSIDQLIAYTSKYMTLKMGDYIYTGTPAGVGPVKIDDHLEAFIGDKRLLSLEVK